MKQIDIMDLLFLSKKEFQALDGEFFDQLPDKQIARMPYCLWDMMTIEQFKKMSIPSISKLDYNELVKLYIKYSNETEPYTTEYKLRDKIVTVESKSLESKIIDTIQQQKKYGYFKARNRLKKSDCENGMLFTNSDSLYSYLPKPGKEFVVWDENRNITIIPRRINSQGTNETYFYYDFTEIHNMLKIARRDGEFTLPDDEIPPLVSFVKLMEKYNVKYSLTNQFCKRWKMPYYLIYYGKDFSEVSNGTKFYDIVECKPMIEKILQIEFIRDNLKKYKEKGVLPKYCFQKIYPFLDTKIDDLVKTNQINLYRSEDTNLLSHESVLLYFEKHLEYKGKLRKKQEDTLPLLIDFNNYFKDLNLPVEILEELRKKLDTYLINDTVYLSYPFEPKHKKNGKYDKFRMEIIETIKPYVKYHINLEENLKEYKNSNKIPDIFIECLISKLLINYPEVKEYYLSNVQEFYQYCRLDGIGYGDIAYMDFEKVCKYFDL